MFLKFKITSATISEESDHQSADYWLVVHYYAELEKLTNYSDRKSYRFVKNQTDLVSQITSSKYKVWVVFREIKMLYTFLTKLVEIWQ